MTQKSPSAHHRTTLSGYIFATKRCKTLSSNISSTCLLDMVNVGPLTAADGLPVLGTPSKFQWVSGLDFVTAPTSLNRGQPNFAQCLAISWTGTLYINFRGLLPPNGILPDAEFTLRPSLAFSYIFSVTARHSSSGRQPNCGVLQRAPPIFGRMAITLGVGPHSSLTLFLRAYFEKNCTAENLDSHTATCEYKFLTIASWHLLCQSSRHELTFTFATCCRPSVCRLSSVCFTEIVPGEPLRREG